MWSIRWMHWDRLAKNQPAEITMCQISEEQEASAFNGRRSLLTLRHPLAVSGYRPGTWTESFVELSYETSPEIAGCQFAHPRSI